MSWLEVHERSPFLKEMCVRLGSPRAVVRAFPSETWSGVDEFKDSDEMTQDLGVGGVVNNLPSCLKSAQIIAECLPIPGPNNFQWLDCRGQSANIGCSPSQLGSLELTSVPKTPTRPDCILTSSSTSHTPIHQFLTTTKPFLFPRI